MMNKELFDFYSAENGYEVEVYEEESCKERKKYVILAESIKVAADYAEQLAHSQFHIMKVVEVGLAMVGVDKIGLNTDRFKSIIKEKGKGNKNLYSIDQARFGFKVDVLDDQETVKHYLIFGKDEKDVQEYIAEWGKQLMKIEKVGVAMVGLDIIEADLHRFERKLNRS